MVPHTAPPYILCVVAAATTHFDVPSNKQFLLHKFFRSEKASYLHHARRLFAKGLGKLPLEAMAMILPIVHEEERKAACRHEGKGEALPKTRAEVVASIAKTERDLEEIETARNEILLSGLDWTGQDLDNSFQREARLHVSLVKLQRLLHEMPEDMELQETDEKPSEQPPSPVTLVLREINNLAVETATGAHFATSYSNDYNYLVLHSSRKYVIRLKSHTHTHTHADGANREQGGRYPHVDPHCGGSHQPLDPQAGPQPAGGQEEGRRLEQHPGGLPSSPLKRNLCSFPARLGAHAFYLRMCGCSWPSPSTSRPKRSTARTSTPASGIVPATGDSDDPRPRASLNHSPLSCA